MDLIELNSWHYYSKIDDIHQNPKVQEIFYKFPPNRGKNKKTNNNNNDDDNDNSMQLAKL